MRRQIPGFMSTVRIEAETPVKVEEPHDVPAAGTIEITIMAIVEAKPQRS
jgi:hypothetical protein